MSEYVKFVHKNVAYYFRKDIITKNEFAENINRSIKSADVYPFDNLLRAEFAVNIKTNVVIKNRYGWEFVFDKFLLEK